MPVMLLGCVNFFTKHLRESEIKFVHLLCVCVCGMLLLLVSSIFTCDVVESESSLVHKLGCSYVSLKSGKRAK